MSILHYTEILEYTSFRKAKWHLNIASEGLLIYTWSLNPKAGVRELIEFLSCKTSSQGHFHNLQDSHEIFGEQ